MVCNALNLLDSRCTRRSVFHNRSVLQRPCGLDFLRYFNLRVVDGSYEHCHLSNSITNDQILIPTSLERQDSDTFSHQSF